MMNIDVIIKLWGGIMKKKLDEPTTLIYYITQRFNLEDEARCDWEMMGWDHRKSVK